ncbi:exocyst complex component 1-like [Tubulanus polymorphus]|uniref:exocyst complex component 1-like n=1 Tax=Tubulanus polymorphus TaxID=672921 RepID=UPI003DA48479
MSRINVVLQRDVFLPDMERLIAFVHVFKGGKKKKTSLLCLAVTTEKPVQATIYQVKKSEKVDSYKKKCQWPLRLLKLVDGKDAKQESPGILGYLCAPFLLWKGALQIKCFDMDLHIDKQVYKWVSGNRAERDYFITSLFKLSKKHVSPQPEFVNVPSHILEEVAVISDTVRLAPQGDDISVASDDYQALSTKEETDLETLMSQCEFSISNAEAFAEQLSKDLSVLDGENIHSIMGSEDQVNTLMQLLEDGINEAQAIEEKLDAYDEFLKNMKDLMETMKEKDALIHIQNRNHQRLLERLDSSINQLDLQHSEEMALLGGDLTSPNGISECTAAAETLQGCIDSIAKLPKGMNKLKAIQDQEKRFNKLRANFAKRLSTHLNKFFIHLGNELGETLNRYTQDLSLPKHHSSHRDLLPYAEVMLWLKGADPTSFSELAKVYTKNLSRIYEREIKEFMDLARQKLTPVKDKKGIVFPASRGSGGSSQSLNKDRNGRASSFQDTDSYHGSEIDLTSRAKFDQIFEKVLCELEPVCLGEQEFCIKFFHISTEPVLDVLDLTESGSITSEEETSDKEKRKALKMINEELRHMMVELFPSLESELMNLIAFGDKVDPFNSMYMLVRMNQHVSNTQDAGSFLSMIFGSSLIHIKRNFDKFIAMQIQIIEDTKVSKKTRCGVLSFVKNFEEFANQAEIIFKNSERHTDLEKAYIRLVNTIFQQIAKLAAEQQKSPQEVILMENFHRMLDILSQMRLAILEPQRKEAKLKYSENLSAYVTAYLGRPLEKLGIFFDGIESRVAAGVKMEEVGYQLAFSKQEVKKVIKEYPGKEVKKGLEHLSKKVEKHLCDEENLFQVVWLNMQDEFIKQYKYFETLIQQCYPGSGISLEFNVNDILQYFSEIAVK